MSQSQISNSMLGKQQEILPNNSMVTSNGGPGIGNLMNPLTNDQATNAAVEKSEAERLIDSYLKKINSRENLLELENLSNHVIERDLLNINDEIDKCQKRALELNQ